MAVWLVVSRVSAVEGCLLRVLAVGWGARLCRPLNGHLAGCVGVSAVVLVSWRSNGRLMGHVRVSAVGWAVWGLADVPTARLLGVGSLVSDFGYGC